MSVKYAQKKENYFEEKVDPLNFLNARKIYKDYLLHPLYASLLLRILCAMLNTDLIKVIYTFLKNAC